MRRSFALVLPDSGLPGAPAPVAGSIRIRLPFRPVGSPGVRRSCERRRPPSEVGGESSEPTPPGGSPHGLAGVPVWPQSHSLAVEPSEPDAYR